MKVLVFLLAHIACEFCALTLAQIDSLSKLPQAGLLPPINAVQNSGLFRAFSGGFNALYQNTRSTANIDLSVQTYHYYLITGKRKNYDSLRQVSIQSGKLHPNAAYRGIDFYILSRASLDFDTLRSIANDYLTSLLPSPLTIRLSKEYFLSRLQSMNETDYSPVASLQFITDIRVVPYNRDRTIQAGVSTHGFVRLSAQFKRLEFDSNGKVVDKGTVYFQPCFGLGFGSPEMMKTVNYNPQQRMIYSTECKLGFASEHQKVKDCAILVRYCLSKIMGPQLRVGLQFGTFN